MNHFSGGCNLIGMFYRIGGVLFSSLISDSPSVGASTSIYGLIGAYVDLQSYNHC
jgi:membrane associated rhomboid family serine protease